MKLDEYRKCFTLSFDEFVAHYNIHSNQIVEHVRYERIIDVTRVDLPEHQFFFFKDGQLKMIYISDESSTKKVWEEFKTTVNVNTPDKTVRSRAGKTSNQEIFATQGITASITRDEVDFIEIYPACWLEEYLENVYREVGPFIR